MAQIHEDLARMVAAGRFEPYLRYIRFPHFRNLRDGTRIDFLHPITALVGPNGTNKTAILRAIQGCPDYYNVGQYWFSTELDPIKVTERHRFIHGYLGPTVGVVIEAIKSRIARGSNPDYFEPSRPLTGDGMERMPELSEGEQMPAERVGTRWKAINKNVLYLDFRSELSAYDKYFYHMPPKEPKGALASKKAVIRSRARHLANSLNTGRRQHLFYGKNRIATPAKELDAHQRQAISGILGREYSSIKVISHSYYGVTGSTEVISTR